MSRVVLTIDDAPTSMTPRIVDYLRSKNISPVINFIGGEVDSHFDEAIYAVKSGAVIGNHSFSHPYFSSLSLEECREEIMKTEREIDRVYQAAGMKREHRVFRFPYGDKGGTQAEALQEMLRDEFHFERLDDSEIDFPWWEENHLDKDIDMLWTFDFLEYQLSWDNDFKWDDIMKRIHDENPECGGYLLGEGTTHIALIHDIEKTEKCVKMYFEKIIDYVLAQNVEFIQPRFIS